MDSKDIAYMIVNSCKRLGLLEERLANLESRLAKLEAASHVGMPFLCEHGIHDGNFCPDCSAEFKRSVRKTTG